MKSAENILKLKKELEANLRHINDEHDRGNSELFDALHEKFTVNINGQTVSLGSMDAYSLFQQFLSSAQSAAEDLDLDLK